MSRDGLPPARDLDYSAAASRLIDRGYEPADPPAPGAGVTAAVTAWPENLPPGTGAGEKPTNPKDAFGILKGSISYVSMPVIMEVSLGMMEGGFKYGAHNYRVIGVRASVYVDATFRHLAQFWEGEDIDPESGAMLSHITKAITSLVVLRDAMIQGKWVDDRPPKSPQGWLSSINAEVVKLASKFTNPVARYLDGNKRGPGRT